jgi:quinol monooxygenase YgiN
MIHAYLSLTALPHRRDDLLAGLDALELAAAADDAYLLEVDVEVSFDDPDNVLVISAWPSREHYERWRREHGWHSIVKPLDPLLAAEPEIRVYRLADSIT